MFRLLLLCGALAAAYVILPRNAGGLSAPQLAMAAQRQLPIPVGNGAHVVAIAAEGDTLVFGVDGPGGWLQGKSSAEVAAAMRQSLCRTDAFREVFGSGKSVRVDVSSDGGAPVPGELITDCPASLP